MFQDKPEWIAHERKRWMRPDAERWLKPDAHKWMMPEEQRWFLPECKQAFVRPEPEPIDLAALEGARQQLLRLRDELLSLRAELKFREFFRSLKAGFNLDQPRVPPGNPDGGQWTNEGGEAEMAATPANYAECLNRCFPLLERRQPPGSDRNTWDFHKCMNDCLQRVL